MYRLAETAQWHAKADAETSARIEEVEELRRKFTVRIQEQEEHIETLLLKVNNLEKQKSRLQSEVEVLIIDLERANSTARDLQKRVDQLERTNIEIKTRLEETLQLYETAQRDLRNKQVEIVRLNNEMDKIKDQRDTLVRENKKLGGKFVEFDLNFMNVDALKTKSFALFPIPDDLGDARNTITELTRRYHELELEVRRLENERDELTAAYKEAEAVSITESFLILNTLSHH